jgi:hypothetical protein
MHPAAKAGRGLETRASTVITTARPNRERRRREKIGIRVDALIVVLL